MNTKRIEQSLKVWKKTKNRGAIVHQAEMINEQIHVRTIRIRECKKGMEEADRIHALMRKKELERLEEMYGSHLSDKRMVNLCMKSINKGKKYDLKEPEPVVEKVVEEVPIVRHKHPTIIPKEEFIPPDPIEEIIAEVPVDLTKEQVEQIEEKIEDIPLTPEEKTILIAEKEAAIKALEDEAEFPCPHCERIYATESSRKRHITMRHKEV